MIGRLKALTKRYWPQLRLRTILLATLLFVAALPGVGAIFLRVYENTLVRQTEAELVAQGAALAATAEALWSQKDGPAARPSRALAAPDYYAPEPPTIDLQSTPVLPERPPARRAPNLPPDPQAVAAAAKLAPILARTARTTLASIRLIDRNGTILSGPQRGGSHAFLPEVQAALKGAPETVLRRNGNYRPRYSFEWLSRASALWIHHARPIKVNGRVAGILLLSRSPRALFKGLYQDRGKILLGIVLIFGALVVIAGLLSRGIAQPIERLGAATRKVASGDGDIPEPPVTAAIEIRALYENFAAMAEKIARRSRYLRDFAAAVSHEFKTPLAGIRGAIELLEDHHATMTEAERQRFQGNIAADAERLSHLVTRLLDLARADMTQPEPGSASDIADAVKRVADAFQARDFSVGTIVSANLPKVAVPQTTIEATLSTLLENSRQAGARRAEISVREGANVELVISDDGPGVPDADQPRLFEPFFTSRRAEGGTGLGLPIVRSLLKASRAEIEFRPCAGGATFVVILPRAQLANG
jgi:signal transduction histidine kinase